MTFNQWWYDFKIKNHGRQPERSIAEAAWAAARMAAAPSEGVTCPECATARAAANSWKDELMRLKSAQPAGAVALEAQEVVERWNHAVEECALAAEHVTPRHTECGNKIARAIRALKGLPSAPSAIEEKMAAAVREAFEYGVCAKSRYMTRGCSWRSKHAEAIEAAISRTDRQAEG